MPLKFTHRKENEVPSPSRSGRTNPDLVAIKNEMTKLAAGMVLEIETGSEKAIRGTKMLITKAAKELNQRWRHWSEGSTVFAKPVEAIRRRGRKPKMQ